MKKILVTTDFSAHSEAAMRFAIQVATQGDVGLTFLHICHIPRQTTWNDATYAIHEQNKVDNERKTLDRFVESVYASQGVTPANYTCIVKNSPFTDSTIKDHAADHAFDYICMSTRGAGLYEKLFGTTTSNLINQSPVPVIAVPGHYRTTKLTTVLYASDLTRLEELKKVVDFAKPLSASVELLHFRELSEPVVELDIIGMAVQKQTDYPVALHLKFRNLMNTLTADIEEVVQTRKPSMLIMFTTQKDGFFSRLFGSGNSIDYSFLTTVPLLVFSKNVASNQ